MPPTAFRTTIGEGRNRWGGRPSLTPSTGSIRPAGGLEVGMTGARKILVIDDDPDFRASVQSLLEAEGHEVVQARSGKEGLKRLSEARGAAATS